MRSATVGGAGPGDSSLPAPTTTPTTSAPRAQAANTAMARRRRWVIRGTLRLGAIFRRHGRDRCHEVRRHLRGRRRAHQARGGAHRAQRRSGQPRGGGAVGARQAHRRARRHGPRGLRSPAPARDGHAALDRGAHLVRPGRDGDQRPRPRGDLADRVPGRDRHGLRAYQGAHPRGQGPPHPGCARRRKDRARGRLPGGLPGLARRDHARPRRVGHHRRRARRRARRRRSARSTPTSPASSAPTRASCPSARKLPVVTFEEMLEMSASGAGVLQLRSVEYARNHGVAIHCRSSFEDGPGTVVQDEELTMERPLVTAVTHSTSEARITLTGLPDRPGIAGRVLTALADANVNVDMIIQNEPAERGAPGRHVGDRAARRPARRRARRSSRSPRSSASEGSQTDDRMGKVSLVGAGMSSHPGVAAKALTVLGEAEVNIEMISTSPIKISCVVREEDVETAVRELHTAFGLGADAVHPEDVVGRPQAEGGLANEGRGGRSHRRRRLDDPRRDARARLPRRRDRPLRLGALRRAHARLRRPRPHGRGALGRRRSRASTLRCSRPAPQSAPTGRRSSRTPARWWSTTRRSGACTRTCRWWSPRSTREALEDHRGIVANPNCTTMQTVMALGPILRRGGNRARDHGQLPGGLRDRAEGGRGAAPTSRRR